MTKAGIEGFTRSLAKELGKYRIRSNALRPYVIDTPLFHNSPLNDKQAKMAAAITPLKRIGQPDEVADMILFLASDASSYVTGNSMDISGGL